MPEPKGRRIPGGRRVALATGGEMLLALGPASRAIGMASGQGDPSCRTSRRRSRRTSRSWASMRGPGIELGGSRTTSRIRASSASSRDLVSRWPRSDRPRSTAYRSRITGIALLLQKDQRLSPALVRLGAAAVPGLAAGLSGPGGAIRMRSALVRGRIGREASGAAPCLEKAIEDDDPYVGEESRQALEKIRGAGNSGVHP